MTTTPAGHARRHGWTVGCTLRHDDSRVRTATVTAIGMHKVLIFDGHTEWATLVPEVWTRDDTPHGGLA